MTQVAAAIIRNEAGEILICQRGAGGSCAYLWEFPGGKREPGETLEQCLLRECKEELEVDIEAGILYAETTHTYPEQDLAFSFFEAKIVSGNIKMVVHDDMKWVKETELSEFTFCPADIEMVEKLQRSIRG